MKTLNSRLNPADICRANGWGVGTRLVGDEDAGPTIIEITALGERMMLAKRIRDDGELSYESSWNLSSRDWKRDDESLASPKAAAVTGPPRTPITPLATTLAPIRERDANFWRTHFTAAGEPVHHDRALLLNALEAVDAELIERAASYRATANILKQKVGERHTRHDLEDVRTHEAYAFVAEATITAVRVNVAFALEPPEDL